MQVSEAKLPPRTPIHDTRDHVWKRTLPCTLTGVAAAMAARSILCRAVPAVSVAAVATRSALAAAVVVAVRAMSSRAARLNTSYHDLGRGLRV